MNDHHAYHGTPGEIVRADLTDLARAGEKLRHGGLVAFPTETVYGLGADALNPEAVARVFEAKGRPSFDPLIVHVDDAHNVWSLVQNVPKEAELLAERFWPGPLTMVLPKRKFIPDLVTSGMPTVAVRVPSHPIARGLIQVAETPLAAPSANRFGGISPTAAEHVAAELGERVDMILDGGPCMTGIESTVVSLAGDEPVVLRLGGLPVESISEALGREVKLVDSLAHAAKMEGKAQAAPGMLAKHYAPATPLQLCHSLADAKKHPPAGRVALLALDAEPHAAAFDAAQTRSLSPAGDLRAAAANLFAFMRELDRDDVDIILAEQVPEQGLGKAINDRLRRAAAK